MYYIAPTYRTFTVLKDDIYEDKKRYGIIDYKGKEKKIRLWDKPQKSWKEDTTCAPSTPSNKKGNFIINEDNTKNYDMKNKTFAEKYGFNEHGFVWFVEAENYGASELIKYLEQTRDKSFRKDAYLGMYTTSRTPPSIQGVTFVRVNKEDVLVSDNVVKSDEEIQEFFNRCGHKPLRLVSCGPLPSKKDC